MLYTVSPAAKYPHKVMLPPQYFTVDMVFLPFLVFPLNVMLVFMNKHLFEFHQTIGHVSKMQAFVSRCIDKKRYRLCAFDETKNESD